MGKSSRSINLLKKDANTFFDDFINWTLGIGRVVIIVTEAIALAVFLYRFSLDRQLIDLRDQIKQKTVIVDLLKNNEVIYRNLQERLALAKQQGPRAGILDQHLDNIVQTAPEGTVFQTITISEDDIRMTVYLISTAALADLVTGLRNNPIISAVSVDKIENKTSQSILIANITALVKK